MRRTRIIVVAAASVGLAYAAACSSDDSNQPDGGNDATTDTTTQDVATKDAANDVTTNDATTDASDAGSCQGAWLDLPDAAMLEPDGGLPPLLLHFFGSGTQDYACEAQISVTTDAGADAGATYVWVLTGPEATLDDCNVQLQGHHFASEAGASAPEWQTLDQSYVIGKKLVAYTPDGGQGSVPWLLLQETSNGGNGTIAKTLWVQRVHTDGGNPTTTCDNNDVDATTKVPYSADYYFYGN